MKRCDMKQLALMGLMGGCLLASTQGSANEERRDGRETRGNENQEVYLAASCGSSGSPANSGCNGRNQPSYPNGNNGPSGSCGGHNGPRYSSDSGCNSRSRPNTYSNYRSSGHYVAENDTPQEMPAQQDFENNLNPQAKAMYQNLSDEGKALAIRLANQNNDPNEAVKQAAKQMAEKRSSMDRNSNGR